MEHALPWARYLLGSCSLLLACTPLAEDDDAATACPQMEHDECIASGECLLDYSLQSYGRYQCRSVIDPCESNSDQADCSADALCHWSAGECYCPQDQVCVCGGGPAPSCRRACGGEAENPCPEGSYCSLQVFEHGWPGAGTPECAGDIEPMGVCLPVPQDCDPSFDAPACGCAADPAATTYTNECVRRQAQASFSHLDACDGSLDAAIAQCVETYSGCGCVPEGCMDGFTHYVWYPGDEAGPFAEESQPPDALLAVAIAHYTCAVCGCQESWRVKTGDEWHSVDARTMCSHIVSHGAACGDCLEIWLGGCC